MLLAIDVGNTNTVIGLYRHSQLVHMWRISTERNRTSDELRLSLCALLEKDGCDPCEARGLVLASVVPSLSTAWNGVSETLFGRPAVLAHAAIDCGLFQADYPYPEEIGADRIADAVGAQQLYGAPAIVVDFGTATNIEVIDAQGVFLGGVIAPGVETSAQALFSRAARLSAIELKDPHTAIGKNTDEAVQAGIFYGEIDRVDGLVRRIFNQLGYEAPVIATGGLAQRIAPTSQTITYIDEELTLEGLRLIFEYIHTLSPERTHHDS